ncbi:ribose 5-phosphate isomerase A, partial [Pancytospora epiphaga]
NKMVGIGSGTTMRKFSKYLTQDKTYVASSIQAEMFLGKLPTIPVGTCRSLDVYFDSADFYLNTGELIKGGGGSMVQERLLAKLAKRTVIIVQRSKLRESFDDLFVPVEIIKSSFGYISKYLQEQGIAFSLREVNKTTPFLTDNGNLIVDVRYNEDFLRNCEKITGVLGHGYFKRDDNFVIEEI